MKVLVASGVALALMTGAVMAQRAAPAPAGMAQGAPGGAAVPAPPPPPDADGMAPPPPGGPGPMADRGPAGPDGRRAPPPPPPPRGAHIDLQRGDLRVNLNCAEGESTKTCADTAMQMLDHLQAAPRAQ